MVKITPLNNNGWIMLRFTVNSERYSFNPAPGSKYSDKLAFAKAEEIAHRIEQDCITGYFDSTLTKYKPNATKGRTAADAIREAEEAKETVAARLSVDAVDLSQLFEDYIQFKRKNLKENSVIDYNRIQNKLKKCPHKLVRDAKDIMQWLVNDHKGTSSSTLEKHLKLMSACCKWGVSTGKLQTNRFDGLKTLIPSTKHSRSQDEINPFTGNERSTIIQAFYASDRYRYYAPLVEFMFYTGCRPSEALALHWKHVKGSKVTFCQKRTASGKTEPGTKTQDKRSITVPSRIEGVLNGLRTDTTTQDDLVFPAKKGGLIDWHNFANRAWRAVLATLADDIVYKNPYQMRHTAISEMIKGGVDSILVARWVGNSPSMISKKYLSDVSDIAMPDSRLPM
ncbi:MAG TPA: tyrosine-type recombinase/integrase [Nostoc sp.]|uniref:site-specific integrase n=1 Tax=Nostoc sp. TaxID=1180 RepID=UPI002D525116|nr:tyrosine-type recombinase/integrase [Nostoc sp.]HYX13075.1 tyrosine-type recombinase/integrase [Nostoc sp.]